MPGTADLSTSANVISSVATGLIATARLVDALSRPTLTVMLPDDWEYVASPACNAVDIHSQALLDGPEEEFLHQNSQVSESQGASNATSGALDVQNNVGRTHTHLQRLP